MSAVKSKAGTILPSLWTELPPYAATRIFPGVSS
ncbi:hypothetical protein SK3146_04034 [Paenibacillus konkukensis]|uniref:Uncharacterized protein n=1 Tax=Paenibacillus konkukensis TaxID=2020716 RepID=A0ABY4RTR8_9BACL|nr:hypothetical protein SK3146_04034 [Paenibacillus konkukensis]